MNKMIVGIFVILIGGVIGWYYFRGNAGTVNTKSTGPTSAVAPSGTTTGSNSGTAVMTGTATVTYTDNGFNPERVTVKKGTTVTFVNKSSSGMWVASGVHPTHKLLPGFDELTSVANGGSYDYAFVKVGTWQYHNHLKPTDISYVVVTE